MNLKRTSLIVIIFILSVCFQVEAKKGHLIVGQNTVQKIFYETSSSYSSTHEGYQALDGDRKTSWVSSNGNGAHWYTLNFGTKRIMTSIVISAGRKNNYRTLKTIKLQFLYKNKWFDFDTADFVNETVSKGEITDEKVRFNLGGIDASTFRIFIPEGSTYKGYAAIAEVETYIGSSKIEYYDSRLRGMCIPVKNAFLPKENYSYPNAPRKYRGGKHVGLDLYNYFEGPDFEVKRITSSTPILAAADGVIIRADTDYRITSPEEWKNRSKYYRNNPGTFIKRSFGGRQVWIDHQNGIVTAYNHMSGIDPSVKNGTKVKKGQCIGRAGNSGLLGEVQGNQKGVHLHFEIWVDGYYLGYGMSVKDIKKYLVWIFFQTQ